MKKLNFGCGNRFAKGWVNIDFHSQHPEVQRVNLLQKFPFADGSFDVVYSSHVLEHFPLATTEGILRECHRVLKSGGIVRTVLPSLEFTCREYVKILDEVASSELARRQHEWIVLELLDQLTRTKPSGLIAPFRRKLEATNDQELIAYVQSRTDTIPWAPAEQVSFGNKLRSLTFGKLRTKLVYCYVDLIKALLPPSLRATLVDDTRIGEKHKWMYSPYSFGLVLQRCGFGQIKSLSASESDIPDFNADLLDMEADGRIYKPGSIFSEARKP
ncbi:MAG: methyltransferase domain-containing protein [Verrucomicrobiota bacterium]